MVQIKLTTGFPRHQWRIICQIADGLTAKEIASANRTSLQAVKAGVTGIRRRCFLGPADARSAYVTGLVCERLRGCISS